MSFPDFLKSLETEGGKMFIIIGMLVFIIACVMIFVMTGHPLQESGRLESTGAISALLGILYGYLKPGAK